MILIYGKHKEEKKYAAMNMTAGVPVANLIYATKWGLEHEKHVDEQIETLNKDNPDWHFKKKIQKT